jgi:hypothetical protein
VLHTVIEPNVIGPVRGSVMSCQSARSERFESILARQMDQLRERNDALAGKS